MTDMRRKIVAFVRAVNMQAIVPVKPGYFRGLRERIAGGKRMFHMLMNPGRFERP